MTGGCTIISPNYHALAKSLSDSYRKQHPGHQFFVLIVADVTAEQRALFYGHGYCPIFLSEIGLKNVRSLAMKYNILELNTNVKPTLLKYLMREYALESLVYLDPDIFVYSPLTPVFAGLENANVLLTPHMTVPVNDGKVPGEQEMLYNGIYNLGFIAVRRSDESSRLLNWWEERCLESGFSEGRTGLFVDQKWMNLAPCFFDGISLLRHRGCNMAFWNLHERSLSKSGDAYYVFGEQLCFFHFSGVTVDDPASLSRNTDRFRLADRPDLQSLFDDYKSVVRNNADARIDTLPYGFDRFSDGRVVTLLARRIYAQSVDSWLDSDPFDASGQFAIYARRAGLIAGKTKEQHQSWREFNASDWRVRFVNRLLRGTLRLLGPNRYELFMRYLAHMTVLRNQSQLLLK